MANVVFVTGAPTLGKDEIVIAEPDFAAQVKASNFKASGKKLTSQNHLNQIVTLIRNKYDREGDLFESTMRIPYRKYVGLAYKDEADVSAIICRILTNHCPAMLDRAVEFDIKNRPVGTKTIYFTGPASYGPVFIKEGVSPADPTPAKKTKQTEKAE